jgi:hypothetical protein
MTRLTPSSTGQRSSVYTTPHGLWLGTALSPAFSHRSSSSASSAVVATGARYKGTGTCDDADTDRVVIAAMMIVYQYGREDDGDGDAGGGGRGAGAVFWGGGGRGCVLRAGRVVNAGRVSDVRRQPLRRPAVCVAVARVCAPGRRRQQRSARFAGPCRRDKHGQTRADCARPPC